MILAIGTVALSITLLFSVEYPVIIGIIGMLVGGIVMGLNLRDLDDE